MKFNKSISLKCPHCNTTTQFYWVKESHKLCRGDNFHYISYVCTHCEGVILTKWFTQMNINEINFESGSYTASLKIYYPIIGDWEPRIKFFMIIDENVRRDFEEAIGCYNNGFYNASMMMSRRAIQQEMITKKAQGDGLYTQINSLDLSRKLKGLLQKVKNFGNSGAHPDFCLYDEEGNILQDVKGFAKLGLDFLDRYFIDEYETQDLIDSAPKSNKELKDQ
jgi:hypothetical protein